MVLKAQTPRDVTRGLRVAIVRSTRGSNVTDTPQTRLFSLKFEIHMHVCRSNIIENCFRFTVTLKGGGDDGSTN